MSRGVTTIGLALAIFGIAGLASIRQVRRAVGRRQLRRRSGRVKPLPGELRSLFGNTSQRRLRQVVCLPDQRPCLQHLGRHGGEGVKAAFEQKRTSRILVTTKRNEVRQRAKEADATRQVRRELSPEYVLLRSYRKGRFRFLGLASEGEPDAPGAVPGRRTA